MPQVFVAFQKLAHLHLHSERNMPIVYLNLTLCAISIIDETFLFSIFQIL